MTNTDFIDLQVNGYAGADFNRTDISAISLHRACAQLQIDGVAGILATVITDNVDSMAAKLSRLVQLRKRDPVARDVIRGFHIEGPFINSEPGYLGAHPAHAACPANLEAMKRLLDAAGGLTRVVTLAPECDPGSHVIRYLVNRAVVVAAGHTDASLDQLRAGIDAGLSMFTHLGNGCPARMNRHDNIIQRVLSLAEQLWISFIADGAHVPFFALRNYLALVGIDRAVIVTDAISAAGLGAGRYTLGDREVDIGEDLVPRAEDKSHLIGSAITMPRVVANLCDRLALTDKQVHEICSNNPRRVLGMA